MKRILVSIFLMVLVSVCVNGQTVVSEKAVSVAAGQYVWWSYNLAKTSRLWGKFRATGGKNDIEVYIVDDDGLENFQNGNQFTYYYFSGRVTTATFDRTLPKGSYHLVFNNRWSLVTPKAVTVRFYSDTATK